MSLHLVEGAVIADRFCLVRQLGKGGMGEVWLARHEALDVLCAVKLIDLEAAASPELLARFKFEAQAAAQIRSAHAVKILDSGVFDGRPYIAMEYLEGEDLRARLARVRVLGARATASIIAEAARGVGQAHDAGIIHRDLKPANLFFCREGDREIVKVLDFGVAKRVGGSPGIQTSPDMLIGTLFYMSPEQAQRNRTVDHRADLWALGVIAFRCLTGKLPFKGATLVETLMQIIADPIPVPSRIASVPAGFDAWWARATSRDPEHRFQSAKDLADSLQTALGLPGTLDPVEPPATARLRALKTTLPMADEGRGALPSPQRAAPLVPSPQQALAATLPDAPSPPAVSRAPVITMPAKSLLGTKIAAAFTLMALGALAAWYVAPRPTAADAPMELPSVAATDLVLTAAEVPSAALPAPSPSSATTPPRAVTPLPPAKPSAASVRPPIKPPVVPARFTPPGERTFDPGI